MPSPFDPVQQSSQLDYKLVYALERISQIYRTLLWQTQSKTGLSPIQSQMLIFMLLHAQERVSISAFAEEFSVTKATISDAIKTLVKKGLVKKEQDPVDKRKQTLLLTTEGISVAQEIQNFTSPLQEIIAQTTQAQKTSLFNSLSAILQGLNETGLLSSLRMCTSCHYYDTKDAKAYCNLMQTALKKEEIRLDCPEHLNVSS